MVNNKTKIFISNDPKTLDEKLSEFAATATVEAEYGDTLVRGSVLTLAHHGINKDNPAPCVCDNINLPHMIEAIGISHFDLDTLGGIMAIYGLKDSNHSPLEFHIDDWNQAALIDTDGIHRREPTIKINAFYAYSEKNRINAPRDGSVEDVTDRVMAAADYIRTIDDIKLANGRDWEKAREELKFESLINEFKGVALRSSDRFVNHLYSQDIHTIVGFNKKTGSITISTRLEDIPEEINCRTLVQKLWGTEAGGHAGIAGSPRGVAYDIENAKEAFGFVINERKRYWEPKK